MYDGNAIERAISEIARWDAGWDVALARAGVRPLSLAFEEVVADLDGTVWRVAKHIGVDLDPTESDGPKQPVRQGDQLNDEWRARFLGEGKPILPPPAQVEPRPLHKLVRRLRAAIR